MKVYGKCLKCSNEIAYATSANTRVEFAMQDGKIIKLTCKNCGKINEFHVDKLHAKQSNFAKIGAGVSK
ncbi:hypothetical protein DFQ03_2074 [Maribacter caenipelagi]|uniref:Uncharacterized protein n=1 Tax=Maribacter caenipelagi TaxID=1447781 RepID=A0A4R7D333_9FLAO|nr:hypothetical protein DFQ03_2074 [Maribacter caenipelagi]